MSISIRNILLMTYMGCVACSGPNKPGIKIIDPKEFIAEDIKLSTLVSEIKYIPLSQDLVLNHINSLDFSDEFIFTSTSQGLLKWSHDGQFIGMIGRIGQDPAEYTVCNDFTIDQKTERIYIRDYTTIKVFSFDGTFIKTIRLETADHIRTIWLEDKMYLFHLLQASTLKTPFFWSVIDATGRLVDKKENFDVVFDGNGFTTGVFPYKREDFIVYWNQYNDTVFHIYDNDIQPAYIWSQGNYRYTTQKALSDNSQDFLFLRKLFDTKNFLYLTYSQYGKSYVCIYNKNEDRFSKMVINSADIAGIENDIDCGLPMDPRYIIHISGEDYFVQIIYPNQLIEHIEENRIKTPSLLTLKTQIDEDDNSILILHKIK